MRATGNKEGSRELHAHGAAAQRSAKRAKTLSKRHHHEAQKSHAQHKDKKRKRKHHRGHHRHRPAEQMTQTTSTIVQSAARPLKGLSTDELLKNPEIKSVIDHNNEFWERKMSTTLG